MTINESFFGQYSVFCVFGSVVGCVVVPLIAQVLQQQSMECMILSAIVISLTAAHLNKKGGHDNPNSKILIAKELEKKKANHNNNNNNKKHKHQANQFQHSQQQLSNTVQFQNEHQYMQQHEHLKVAEMERRNEEKRLKKIKKREERLKKREEEHKKQQELDERYRVLKEKKSKHKENFYKNNKSSLNSAVTNLEKYCPSEYADRRQQHGLSPRDENRHQKQTYNTQQRIPRFERNRTTSTENAPLRSSYGNRMVTDSLHIKCSNLSASCSSLSSISSSGSSSPPLPASPPPCNNPVWKIQCNSREPGSSPSSMSPWLPNDRGIKSYSSVRLGKNKPTRLFDNTSLFCSQLDADKPQRRRSDVQEVQPLHGGEYSLFGPRQFGNAFKSPVM